ncbi:MAG: ferritin-like domain-containing protein [Anaerolineae bacterium]|nr:ferritin-like domain-containing protein [Anaerolineae bacterium]
MKIKGLHELMLEQLEDVYDAEHQIVEALPKLAEAAASPELKTAFNDHLAQAHNHIERLEQAFKSLGETPARKTCKGMQGLIQEGDEMLEMDADPAVMDAGLIAAAQRVEHYEMAGYGTLRTYAHLMNHTEAGRLFQQTLEDEEVADKKLSQIATRINVEALN